MFGLMAMAALTAAQVSAQPVSEVPSAGAVRTITNPNQLRDLAKSLAKDPTQPAPPVHFRLELPLVDDNKVDIADLQNSAGWRIVGPMFVINFDMGAVTPDNFNAFKKDDLYNAPPLRTLYFSTLRARQESTRLIPGVRDGEVEGAQGWYETAQSYGLAVAASADAHGRSGGDLPDDFTLPFALQFPRPPGNPAVVASQLRIRVEGELRSERGRSVLCGDQRNGVGYAVDEFTQKTPYMVAVHQCLLPAVIQRISLVKLTGGPPLKVWTRTARAPTPQTDETRVKTGLQPRVSKDVALPTDGFTLNSTAPLPKRGPGG